VVVLAAPCVSDGGIVPEASAEIGAAVFELEGVGFVRDGRQILADVDWRILPGERFALLGPNGCGKSTLLKLAIGTLWPTTGSIRRLGEERLDLRAFRRRIGWITDAVAEQIPPAESAVDTVLSGIFGQLGLTLYSGMDIGRRDRERAAGLLEQFGCGGLVGREFGTLSQGEKRKVLVARALVADPLCLVLDEPCSGMDPGARERFLAWLGGCLRGAAGPAVVLVTHHVEEILPEFGGTLVLRGGRVLARGRTAEVVTAETLEALYDARLEALVAGGGRFWPVWNGGPSQAGRQTAGGRT
jgi:iron complex transport system ATP-binding protein